MEDFDSAVHVLANDPELYRLAGELVTFRLGWMEGTVSAQYDMCEEGFKRSVQKFLELAPARQEALLGILENRGDDWCRAVVDLAEKFLLDGEIDRGLSALVRVSKRVGPGSYGLRRNIAEVALACVNGGHGIDAGILGLEQVDLSGQERREAISEVFDNILSFGSGDSRE